MKLFAHRFPINPCPPGFSSCPCQSAKTLRLLRLLGCRADDKKSDMPPKMASIPAGGGAPRIPLESQQLRSYTEPGSAGDGFQFCATWPWPWLYVPNSTKTDFLELSKQYYLEVLNGAQLTKSLAAAGVKNEQLNRLNVSRSLHRNRYSKMFMQKILVGHHHWPCKVAGSMLMTRCHQIYGALHFQFSPILGMNRNYILSYTLKCSKQA